MDKNIAKSVSKYPPKSGPKSDKIIQKLDKNGQKVDNKIGKGSKRNQKKIKKNTSCLKVC